MRRLLVLAMGLAALGCSPGSGPKVGGETHWLALCSHDSDCGDEGLQCICGTCTKACEGDEACHGGQCYDSQSPLLLDRCEDWNGEVLPAICLAQCDGDAACKSGQHCVQGACVPTPEDPIRISDFADVSDEVSWTEPVALVTLADTIGSAPPSMLGIWREVDCDPSIGRSRDRLGCLSLGIERDAAGSVRGWLRFDRELGGELGPFAPASDPERGYPSEVAVIQYSGLANSPQSRVDYRILDAQVVADTLTFQWNLRDLWHEWCQLQHPSRWEISGRTFYFCVPQDPTQQSILDSGKVALCKAGDLDPTCGDASKPACACDVSNDPRCGAPFCGCDSQRCDVRPVTIPTQIQFASDGMTAVLSASRSSYSVNATLRRSAP